MFVRKTQMGLLSSSPRPSQRRYQRAALNGVLRSVMGAIVSKATRAYGIRAPRSQG